MTGPRTRPAAMSAWLTSGLLLLAGIGVGLAAHTGVAEPDVAGTLGAASGAAWMAVLPGILAVIATPIAPIAGLALAAGAGVAGVARLVADIFVVAQPASVARPELLYPLSATAFPLRTGAGSWILLLADLVAIAAGVLAARALIATVRELGGSIQPTAAADGGQVRSVPDSPGPQAFDEPAGDPAVGPAPVVRNVQMLAVGFIAIAIFGFSGIQATYGGGYIEMMLFVPGSDAGTVIAPFLLALVALAAVGAAGALPRAAAVALLGGVAAAVAVPALTAIVVATTDAPVELSSANTGVLIGAVVLLAAGLLTRARWRSDPAEPPATTVEAVAGSVRIRWAAAIAGLAAAIALVVGSAVHLLAGSGPAGTIAEQGDLADARSGLSMLLAGILLGVASVAAIAGRSGPVGRSGRAALVVAWGAALWAIARPISILTDYRSGTDQAQQTLSGGSLTPEQQAILDATVAHWSIGPGLWLALLGLVLAVIGAVLAGTALARELDEDVAVRDDDAADDSARLRRLIAAGLAVAAVLALALPLSSVNGVTTAALFSLGADISWAGWGVLAAVGVALVLGAVTSSGEIALGALLAAAGVVLVYVWSPSGVRSVPGFRTDAGTIAGWVLVALLVAGGVAMWRSAARVRVAELQQPLS